MRLKELSFFKSEMLLIYLNIAQMDALFIIGLIH